MNDYIGKIKFWIRQRYNSIVNSIAFYPAFISLTFLIISFILIRFDFSETGRQLKSSLPWLGLKDAATARNIIAVVAGGILSLTVFSFSMVMIVLNQAASQMSNRVLNKLIGNRFQQIVLGSYIGTIMFALFLLTTIRDIDSGIHIPSISTYTLIILSIIDIFLFIYFLHYITQSVKYEVIINRILNVTHESMEDTCQLHKEPDTVPDTDFTYEIIAPDTGVFEGVDVKYLLKICNEEDCRVYWKHTPGTFLLKGLPVLQTDKKLDDDVVKKIQNTLYLNNDEAIANNFLYGFRQLTEVGVKALSPGINDPGTASLALRSLFQLYNYRICFFPAAIIKDKNDIPRIYTNNPDFEEIFKTSVLPIWDYGKDDRIIQEEMKRLLEQFISLNPNAEMENFLGDVVQYAGIEKNKFK